MKRLIKLTVSLFVCGAILLTGCASAPMPSLPSELKAPNTNYPGTINILAPFFYSESSEQNKRQWLDEMGQRYGVHFNITSNNFTDPDNPDSSASEQVMAIMQGDTAFTGIVQIFGSGSSIKSISESGCIVPLDDYLEDNPAWNALPEDFKSLFELDGHIYAIPTSITGMQYARIIHNEALQKTGITVTDLNSFRDFAVAYAKKTGNATINCIKVSEMTDILNAFGLYPVGSREFGYDPTEGCYVDWMTKGAAVDALEYLRGLYQTGGINLSFTPDGEKFKSGLIASAYGRYSFDDYYTEVITLNPEYPKVENTLNYGFVMTKDTPQPKETINLLVNMLYSSEENYLECWLGSSENYILNSDGTITVEMVPDSEGKYIPPDMPNLTGAIPGIFPYSAANIFYSVNGVIDMELKTDAGKENARLKVLYDSLKDESLVKIPLSYQNIKSSTYEANKLSIYKLFTKCFQDAIISKDKTVQQIVDEYKTAMLNFGGNFMLDEMNAAIGKKTAYYYG